MAFNELEILGDPRTNFDTFNLNSLIDQKMAEMMHSRIGTSAISNDTGDLKNYMEGLNELEPIQIHKEFERICIYMTVQDQKVFSLHKKQKSKKA